MQYDCCSRGDARHETEDVMKAKDIKIGEDYALARSRDWHVQVTVVDVKPTTEKVYTTNSFRGHNHTAVRVHYTRGDYPEVYTCLPQQIVRTWAEHTAAADKSREANAARQRAKDDIVNRFAAVDVTVRFNPNGSLVIDAQSILPLLDVLENES